MADFLNEKDFSLGINGLTVVDSDGIIQYSFPRGSGQGYQYLQLQPNGNLEFTYLDSIEAATVADGSLSYAKFAQSIEPVGLEEGLPDPNGYDGPSIIFNILDDKLYRYTGTGWTTAVDSIDIPELSIDEVKIKPNAIGSTRIKDGSIESPKLAANSITSNKIASGAILADKISSNAVTSSKIAAGSITTNKLSAGSVTTNKIATNSITSDKIVSNSITAGKIAAGAISATQLSSTELSAHYSSFGTLQADTANIKNLSVERLKIKNGAVSDLGSTFGGIGLLGQSGINFVDIHSLTIPVEANVPILINAGILYREDLSNTIAQDGSEIFLQRLRLKPTEFFINDQVRDNEFIRDGYWQSGVNYNLLNDVMIPTSTKNVTITLQALGFKQLKGGSGTITAVDTYRYRSYMYIQSLVK